MAPREIRGPSPHRSQRFVVERAGETSSPDGDTGEPQIQLRRPPRDLLLWQLKVFNVPQIRPGPSKFSHVSISAPAWLNGTKLLPFPLDLTAEVARESRGSEPTRESRSPSPSPEHHNAPAISRKVPCRDTAHPLITAPEESGSSSSSRKGAGGERRKLCRGEITVSSGHSCPGGAGFSQGRAASPQKSPGRAERSGTAKSRRHGPARRGERATQRCRTRDRQTSPEPLGSFAAPSPLL